MAELDTGFPDIVVCSPLIALFPNIFVCKALLAFGGSGFSRKAHRAREQVSLAFGLRLWQVIIQGANGAQSQTTDINNESLVNEQVGCIIGAETRRASQRSD